jgi:hypothetical protein
MTGVSAVAGTGGIAASAPAPITDCFCLVIPQPDVAKSTNTMVQSNLTFGSAVISTA